MSMAEAAFTPATMARFNMELPLFQPSNRDVEAVRKEVACEISDQPRLAAEVAARGQSSFVVDRGSEGVSL